MAFTLDEVNSFTQEEFNERFSNILERCPEFAERIEKMRPFLSIEHLHSTLSNYLDNATNTRRVIILRGLNDLAGKLTRVGEPGKESSKEQCSAGLDNLTDAEAYTLSKLNEQYKKKFGFPFVLCARQNTKDTIFKGIADRLNSTVEREIFTAIEEVKKISFYRICDLVKEG